MALKKTKVIGTNFHLKAMCPCWYILPFGICKSLLLFYYQVYFFFLRKKKIECLCLQVSHIATHHYLNKNKVLMGSLMVNIQSQKPFQISLFGIFTFLVDLILITVQFFIFYFIILIYRISRYQIVDTGYHNHFN